MLELEMGLKRKVNEKYDIQRVPIRSPIWYNYFITKDGYLFYVTCMSCGVTKISTLLFDGGTPTVNIVSKGMAGKVTKALIREKMLNHPLFKEWQSYGLQKEDYIRRIEKEKFNDSKVLSD